MSLLLAVSDAECECTECGKKIARGQSVCFDSNDYRFVRHENCSGFFTARITKEKIILPWTCPHCSQSNAETKSELIKNFGLRKMSDGTIRNQSWCRECR